MIDPAIWDSEQVMGLTPAQFKIYIYLISQADDEGRLKVAMQLWRTRIFPFNVPGTKDFTDDIQHILDIGLLISYVVDAEMYMYHPNWHRYQKINNPSQYNLPSPSMLEDPITVPLPEDYGSPTVPLPEDSLPIEVKLKEVKLKEDKIGHDSDESDAPPPPSPKKEKEKKLGTEAKACLDYYFQKHLEVREFEPTIAGPRDMAIFKRLLAGYSVEAIEQVIDFFFAYKQRSKFTTRALSNSFDTLYGVMLDKAKGKRK